jgi:glycosyltransferase involved in cell wall biosynthesis
LSDFVYSPLRPVEQFNVFAPGSGRPDKGFYRLAAICRHLSDSMSRPFTLYAQDMPVYRYQKLPSSVSLPVDVPEVVMLPSALPTTSLIALMQASHVVILPYESSVYQYRSSAIMADAACTGRPIVASGGCGFSEDIERFDLGFLAYSSSDFAEKISYLSERLCVSMGPACMEKASSAFANYSHKAIVDNLAGLLR